MKLSLNKQRLSQNQPANRAFTASVEQIHLRSAAIEALGDACLMVDVRTANQPIVFANQAFTELTSYSASEVIGRNVNVLQGRRTSKATIARMRLAIAARRPFSAELINYKKDGKAFWNLMRLSPVPDENGRVTHYVGVLTDVSKNKEREEQIRALRDEISHMNRVATVGELAGGLAHELNQPLTAILSNAQAARRFLQDEEADIEEVEDILNDVVADTDRASAIIRRLRFLLKKDTSHFELLDVNQAVTEALSLTQSDQVISDVKLDKVLSPDLLVIAGDRVQLQQVMLNLIVNATEAMGASSCDDCRIVVESKRLSNSNEIEVAVRDCGPGIEESNLERIFEPFFTTKSSGMGMGLAINRIIVEAHGGRLWAENNPKLGATFYLRLPATERMQLA